MKARHSLTARTLHAAVVRIGIVALCAGLVSYYVNLSTMQDATRAQLLLSTEQTIQRESLPFREIRELQQNFLTDFADAYADPQRRPALVRDFDEIFVRHADGSYTQRPGIFEGEPLADGRRFPAMSATYAPDNPPTDDIKARFALSFLLSYKYGSSTRGRLFNFYGVVPEKGFPIHQDADIAKAFTYEGPDALKLETYEFYERGFRPDARGTFLTRMYFDFSNNAWMTTIATADAPDGAGNHRILACVDVLLDELMKRLAQPAIQGAYSTLFLANDDGTLLFHPRHMDDIRKSDGTASLRSLGLASEMPLLEAARSVSIGKVVLVETPEAIVAVGRIPETPGVLAIHYPRNLLRPALLQNLSIVAAIGLFTLLVEIFLLRSILQYQVAVPLQKLIQATRLLGASHERLESHNLPVSSRDEIGDLAREFAAMADRVQDAHDLLESKVIQRTRELEEANRQLAALSVTDALTGIANRRRFDEVLTEEWRRACRTGTSLSVVMIDVDWFKKFNDHYGHQMGDDCLKAVARALEGVTLRAGDMVARYGGEEFALICAATTADSAINLAHAARAAVEQLELPHDQSPLGRVTISLGLASAVPQAGELPESLLKRADDALYRAKELGRNRAVIAD